MIVIPPADQAKAAQLMAQIEASADARHADQIRAKSAVKRLGDHDAEIADALAQLKSLLPQQGA